MEQRQYWNKVAEKKEFTTPFQTDEFEKYVKKDSVILDVGCGYGRTLAQLYDNGYKNLIGIDFARNMIERGREQFPYLDLRVKEDERIALPDNSVDAVILFAVLTCIVNNEEQRGLIAEIRRVLKPGGILYVNDFLLNMDERNELRYSEYAEKYGTYGVFELPEGALLRHHDEKWLEELFQPFEKKSYEQRIFTTMNGNKSNGFFYIGQL